MLLNGQIPEGVVNGNGVVIIHVLQQVHKQLVGARRHGIHRNRDRVHHPVGVLRGPSEREAPLKLNVSLEVFPWRSHMRHMALRLHVPARCIAHFTETGELYAMHNSRLAPSVAPVQQDVGTARFNVDAPLDV